MEPEKPNPILPPHLRQTNSTTIHNYEDIDNDMQEFTRQLIAKFGKTYTDMRMKHNNQLKYTVEPDTFAVTDIRPLNDNRYRKGVGRGVSGHPKRYCYTINGLANLAGAQAAFYAIELDHLKSEPLYLRKYIEELAHHRGELFPDANGSAPSLSSLLETPRFVGKLCRYAIHNILAHLGTWQAIHDYLIEIQELDEPSEGEGRLTGIEATPRRNVIMDHIKILLLREIMSAEKRVHLALHAHPVVRDIWVRVNNHPDYGGAVIAASHEKGDEFTSYFAEQSMDGAIVRFLARDVCQDDLHWTPHECRLDLFKPLNDDPSLWATLEPFLAERITQLRELMEFDELLGLPVDGPIHYIAVKDEDPRYKEFADAMVASETTFQQINLEKHIKRIDSLERETLTRKIWRDIIVAFDRKHGVDLKNYVGYDQGGPLWNINSTARQPQVRSPSPEPAKIKPYREVASVTFSTDDDVQPGSSRRVKVKTRGAQSTSSEPPTNDHTPSPQIVLQSHEFPVFRLSKNSFKVFEMIFTLGQRGHLDFSEYAKAMVEVGFSYDPSKAGCRVTFYPNPIHSTKSLCNHKPHGNRDDLDRWRLYELRQSLSEAYGWTLEWFGLKEVA
ncbi:hypothetical protein ONZ45_g659 [Pleurotus djamor]|nr:hypothetical protein ONZ45_g659 [Pleurotus djamor]